MIIGPGVLSNSTSGASTAFPYGTSLDYAQLPPFADHIDQVWYVESPERWAIHTKGFYVATLTGWKKTNIKVDLSEDTSTQLNWTNWTSFTDSVNVVAIGDSIIYQSKFYRNLSGSFSSTTPDVDSTNWESHIKVDNVSTNNIQSANGLVQLLFHELGLDQGVHLKGGQFSVGTPDDPREIAIGGGDSYPITTNGAIAFLGSSDNITGLVISSATDVSAILSSDINSLTTPMFASTNANEYLMVGSDTPFAGIKSIKTSLGSIDPINLVAEYLPTLSGWVATTYMASSNDAERQFGWNLSTELIEQWRYGFEPLNLPVYWDKITLNINGIPYTKYWARMRLISPIVESPIMNQIKLQPSHWECNATGLTEAFGLARYLKTLQSGLGAVVPNSLNDPANEIVKYGDDFSAKYIDNEFKPGAVDGFGIVQGINKGLDTSIDLVLSVSFYVKGTSTGDIRFKTSSYQIDDTFVYDGDALPDVTIQSINIPIASNEQRHTVQIPIRINRISSTKGSILVSLTREGNHALDTLNKSVVITFIELSGYFWKP